MRRREHRQRVHARGEAHGPRLSDYVQGQEGLVSAPSGDPGLSWFEGWLLGEHEGGRGSEGHEEGKWILNVSFSSSVRPHQNIIIRVSRRSCARTARLFGLSTIRGAFTQPFH